MVTMWPLLLPIAALSGWLVSERSSSKKTKSKVQSTIHKEYVVGLNYLLNEQPDKAVDVFIKLLDVDSETVETHLALGSLFRRRGEVDRATRIHQNLIARPQLSQTQRLDALIALGQDYLSAGVYDRAERIFKEVSQIGGGQKKESLLHLLEIYQHEQAWPDAISVAKSIEEITSEPMHDIMTHFFCELAMQAKSDKNVQKARLYVKKAMYLDKNSVRASLLMAELDMEQQAYKSAIKNYKKVVAQEPDYVSEVIVPLMSCYRALNLEKVGFEYLEELLQRHSSVRLLFAVAEEKGRQVGLEKALDFVAENLSLHPTIRGLNQLISWHVKVSHGKVKEKLELLYKITNKLLQDKPFYRCGKCGFSGKHLHWQCPSCRKWSTVKPITGFEGV